SVAVATRRLGMAVLGPAPLAEVRRRLDAQLEQRRAWYLAVSDHVVAVDRRSVEEITAEVLTLLAAPAGPSAGQEQQ
ncbi:MAG: hypothetical protein Q4G45_14070, partial [Actinomycetia bacterium]|nr:hypothetical protein [Actinomycetes bacterium]